MHGQRENCAALGIMRKQTRHKKTQTDWGNLIVTPINYNVFLYKNTIKRGNMNNFDGKILISTPKNTSIFKQSVIYVNQDDDDVGSVGAMLNYKMDEYMAEKWSSEMEWDHIDKLYHGGPHDSHLGYIMHSNDYSCSSTITVNDQMRCSGGTEVLTDIKNKVGPLNFMLLTGYCVWEPDQLEAEIDDGLWIITDFDERHMYNQFNVEAGWRASITIAFEKYVEQLFIEANNV